MIPDLKTFLEHARHGNVVPVCQPVFADMLTPVSAYLRLARGRRYSFLLESVEGGERVARYTFLGADPYLTLRARGDEVEIENHRRQRRRGRLLETLREITARYQPVPIPGLPPFSAGAVGYIGYDMVNQFERVPEPLPDDLGMPDAMLMFFSSLLVFDHVKHQIFIIANVFRDEGKGSLESKYRAAVRRIERLEKQLARPTPPPRERAARGGLRVRSKFERPAFESAVARAKEYITAGDIFQVVLSHRLETRPAASPFSVYRALRMVNPSPYMFFLQLGKDAVLGSSPEMLVKVEGRSLEYRPIAGTRPRGATEEEDRALEREMLADEKERAEHIMLVDLGRNDLGRVCEFGSVRVTDLMFVERYSHVMHLVSSIRGKLRPDLDMYDALAACFPAGTLTGAPKVRAMEIIRELEPTRRGIYGGSILYLDFSGNLNSCIAIRTMAIHKDTAYVQVGAGIVADSVPAREYEECMNKGCALLHAIEIAREGL
jgi:anthranilate synthase component 1